MGSLHPGHISLVKKAISENILVIVSIFINPTQFAPGEDLEKYPRDLDRDLNLCNDRKVDIVFVPERTSLSSRKQFWRIGERDYKSTDL